MSEHARHLRSGRLGRCCGAPSVLMPESVIPSAGAIAPLSRVSKPLRFLCLRVSGAVAPSASVEPISPARDGYYGYSFPKVRNIVTIAKSRLPVTAYFVLHDRRSHDLPVPARED